MAKEITSRKRSERYLREKKIRDKATAYLEYTQRLIKLRRKEK